MDLEMTLNAFDRDDRRAALKTLLQQHGASLPAEIANLNMHMHSFFSFNADDWSPTRIAWECRQRGLYATGLCDFDVLDGVEEFFEAGAALGLRVSANLETRAFYTERSDADINSPGEPGVTYIMAGGFGGVPDADSDAGRGLKALADGSTQRNIDLIGRINPHLPEIAIDYEADVLPLVPLQGATERHIIRAYCNKSIEAFRDAAALQGYWSDLLKVDADTATAIINDRPKWEDATRARLVKSGGVGYVQPSEDSFPPVRDFIQWTLSCKAIPMITWLDGTSAGEADARDLCEHMISMGCAALNIVPDRNWNISDPDDKAIKVANLNTMVAVADELHLPINIGTEMNKKGLPFVDDLSGAVLSAHAATFTRGAQIMIGHTNLSRFADYGYLSEQAMADCPDPAKRNDFFARVGALPAITEEAASDLNAKTSSEVLDHFRSAVA